VAIGFLVLVSWWSQELGLSFVTLMILSSLMPILWNWGFQRTLKKIQILRDWKTVQEQA
jgi:hypothetical protein